MRQSTEPSSNPISAKEPIRLPTSMPEVELDNVPVVLPEIQIDLKKETMEELEKRLMADYHLTRDEIRVIRAAYEARRKELFLASRKELQDFINKDYRSANEETLGGEKWVRALQKALDIKVDGKFGPSTFRTLIDYQKKHGLKADGVAGPRTIAKLGIADEINGKAPTEEAKPEAVKTPAEKKPEVIAPPELAKKTETPAAILKALKKHETWSRGIRENLDTLRSSRDQHTGAINATTDSFVEFFGGESGQAIYHRGWKQAREQADIALKDLQNTVGKAPLNDQDRAQYEKLSLAYYNMSQEELGTAGALRSMGNTVMDIPEDAALAAHGAWGMTKGVAEGVVHVFDLTVFLGKMAFSSEYRKAIGKQWDMIMEARKKAGGVTPLIVEAFKAEVTRINNLPSSEQAEAIGKIPGVVFGIGGTAALSWKLGKKGVALVSASRAARAAQSTAEAAAKTAEAAAALATQQAATAPTAAAAATATEEAAAHAAEALKQTAAAAKLGAEAGAAKVQAVAVKAGSIALAGPVEAGISKITSALFSKAFLLIKANKAAPNVIQDAITKALTDNAEQMKVAVESGDKYRIEQLEKQLRFLNESQAKLRGKIPTLTEQVPTAATEPKPAVPEADPVPVPHHVPEDFVYDAVKNIANNMEQFRAVYSAKNVHPDEMTVAEIQHITSLLAHFHEVERVLILARRGGDEKVIAEAMAKMEAFLKNPELPTVATPAAPVSPAAPAKPEAPAATAGTKPEPEFIPKFLRKPEPEIAPPAVRPTEFTYNPNMGIKENIRKFNSIYGPNGAIRDGASAVDIQRFESFYTALSQANDVLKKAVKAGDPEVIAQATADVKKVLIDPDAGVKYVASDEFKAKAVSGLRGSENGAASKPNGTASEGQGNEFLKGVFASTYRDLDRQFSLIKHAEGTPSYLENLLCRELLGVVKEAAQSGRFTWSEAVANLHAFQKNPRKYVKEATGVDFDEAVKRRAEAWRRTQQSGTGR